MVPVDGVTEKLPPLHIAGAVMSVIAGFGLTGTVTVKVAPGQLPVGAVGVTV
jgi:hypothetical protein